MFNRLAAIEEKYETLTEQLSDPETIKDRNLFMRLSKEQSDLKPVVDKFREYKKILSAIEEDEEVLSSGDKELKILAEEELEDLRRRKAEVVEELKLMLLPKDPRDEKNVIIEIRAGTGGEEAALFASDLFKMYSRYAEQKRWKVEVIESRPTGLGGLKEITFSIQGRGAYSRLKYESGVHRVQRVPETETSGRIHTSAATVAVLPEAEEIDISIDEKDLKLDTYRASGAGGQHVNKVSSAVRITHLPSGIVVQCQDERSQYKNREKAMRILRSRLYEIKIEEQEREISEERKAQVGSGDRSERIRTYNFPQNRVTDHRIGLTLQKLTHILEGNLDELLDALITHYQTEKLKKVA
ncbi:Peptide chain release factor 1 [hydrothermal vent metagenome]|uniref:Peptide chain release factor 1 n=1 Tax=hydrothermal vent metagenome TaxID=652676 RepID=A0A3B1D2J8_9ZZZZ